MYNKLENFIERAKDKIIGTKMPVYKSRHKVKKDKTRTSDKIASYDVFPKLERQISMTNFKTNLMINAVIRKMTNTDLPFSDEKSYPPYEERIRSRYQLLINNLTLMIGGDIGEHFNRFYAENGDIKLLFQNPERYYKEIKARILDHWKTASDELHEKFNRILEQLSEDIEETKQEIKKIKEERLELSERLGIKSSHKKVLIVKRSYAILIGIIAIADAIAVSTALSIVREDTLMTPLLTIGIITSLTASSHFGGILLKTYHKDRKRRKLIISVAISTLVFFVATFLGYARLEYITANANVTFPELIQFGFLTLNFVFYGVSLLISYMLHHKDPENANEYNLLWKRLIEKVKELKKLFNKQNKVEQKLLKNKGELNMKFQAELNELEGKESEARQNAVEFTNKLNRGRLTFGAYAGIINQTFLEKIYKARTAVYLKEKKPEYLNQEPESLDTTLPAEKLVYPLKNVFPHENPEYEDFEDPKQNGDSNDKLNENVDELTNNRTGNNLSTVKYPMIIILGLLFNVVVGCNTTEPIDTSIVCIIDATPEAVSENYNIQAGNILELMHIDDDVNRANGGTFSVTSINDVSRNTYHTISLETGGSFENKFNRIDAIEAFGKNLQTILDKTLAERKGYKHSNVYFALCEAAKTLRTLPHKYKKLVVLSDMLENSEVSFYNEFHFSTPDFESLTKKLEKIDVIPDLTGIEIIVVFHTTSPEIDKVVLKAQKYWQFLLENKGAKVSFKANL